MAAGEEIPQPERDGIAGDRCRESHADTGPADKAPDPVACSGLLQLPNSASLHKDKPLNQPKRMQFLTVLGKHSTLQGGQRNPGQCISGLLTACAWLITITRCLNTATLIH